MTYRPTPSDRAVLGQRAAAGEHDGGQGGRSRPGRRPRSGDLHDRAATPRAAGPCTDRVSTGQPAAAASAARAGRPPTHASRASTAVSGWSLNRPSTPRAKNSRYSANASPYAAGSVPRR